jgi:hypothetical protein
LKSIRGGMGLGDALYVQAVARHIVKRGERLKVHTAWPDVFRPLGDKVETAAFTRAGIQYLAHYSLRKGVVGTTQFQDCCITAGIKEPVELRLDWTRTGEALTDRLQSYGKPIVCVQMPRAPMGRTDGFGKELLPDCRVVQRAIDGLKDRALLVQIGHGRSLHEFKGIDVDLSNRTTVCELLDVATVAHGFLGYVSFIVPLAESLDKKALLVWSRKGLKAGHEYVRRITPQKILHKPSSGYAFDDEDISKALHDFL